VPITGRQSGYRPDIEHPWMALEVKRWARLPERVAEALDQAEKAIEYAQRRQGAGKLPVAIIHADHTRFENSLVVLWLRNADEWFGFAGTERAMPAPFNVLLSPPTQGPQPRGTRKRTCLRVPLRPPLRVQRGGDCATPLLSPPSIPLLASAVWRAW
jgi:hypothetical protein